MADAAARLIRVELRATGDRLTEVDAFYAQRLGLRPAPAGHRIGASELAFAPAPEGNPFYHFALLVPAGRFEAALEWARTLVELLPVGPDGEQTMYFQGWDAHACYFHDPVGNIVELIAHRGVGTSTATGAFAPSELLQISEIGLVGDRRATATALAPLGLELAQGSLDGPDGLAFLGPPTSSVILSAVGRGWLPQGRRAEPHPVRLLLAGPGEGEVFVEGHRVSCGA